jgi:hypothetical protein
MAITRDGNTLIGIDFSGGVGPGPGKIIHRATTNIQSKANSVRPKATLWPLHGAQRGHEDGYRRPTFRRFRSSAILHRKEANREVGNLRKLCEKAPQEAKLSSAVGRHSQFRPRGVIALLAPACHQHAFGNGAQLDPALFAHLLPNHMGRPTFPLGKFLERANVIAANAFDEFELQFTLLPLVDLIESFHLLAPSLLAQPDSRRLALVKGPRSAAQMRSRCPSCKSGTRRSERIEKQAGSDNS